MLEIPPLPANTIMLVEVGSTAHGTGLPGGEDLDEMGVLVEDAGDVLGLDERGFRTVMQRTQPEGSRSGPGDIDRTLFSLRQYLRLCASGNPSVIMTLWSPVLEITPAGERLRALAGAFVGRHVIPRYRGYMESQGLRLLGLRSGHGRRGGGGREELIEQHGFDTKYAMHAARLGFQGVELMTTGRLALPIEGDAAEWLRAVRRGEVPFNEWWQQCLELDAQLEQLESENSIPPVPDRVRIENFSIATHRAWWDEHPIPQPSSL